MALFGSSARGEARSDSDRDIFVVARELPDDVLERQMFLRSLIPRELGTRISILAKTKDEFERLLLPVYLDIATDGVILFDPRGYLEEMFVRIRDLLKREGLERKLLHHAWTWVWKKSRGRRDWELDWQ
jgi:predicted nucleotidyltransferase